MKNEYKYSKYMLIANEKNLPLRTLQTLRKLTDKRFQIHYSVHYQP